MHVYTKRCSSVGLGVMNNFLNLNAILKPKRRVWSQGQYHRGEIVGMHGMVLSQCMCVSYIKV